MDGSRKVREEACRQAEKPGSGKEGVKKERVTRRKKK